MSNKPTLNGRTQQTAQGTPYQFDRKTLFKVSSAKILLAASYPSRHAFLEALIGCLKDGSGVSNQDIRSAVTKDEYGGYRAELRSMQPSLRKLPGGGLDGVKRYLELLGKADRLHGRAATVPRPKAGFRLVRHPSRYEQAENAYEDALEALDELVSMNPGAAAFFDRPVTFTLDRYPTLDPESMPRLHTSRSPFALHMVNNTESQIHRLKLATLQASLAELRGDAAQASFTPLFGEPDFDLLPPEVKPFDTSMPDDDFM